MIKILLTGSSGFIGSHLGDKLFLAGYDLMLTRRKTSSMKNTKIFSQGSRWINTENRNWVDKCIEYCPDIIINTAWSGVESEFRDNKEIQEKNLEFIDSLIRIAKNSGVKKFISLGSQAEYGYLDNIINEDSPLFPNTEYGRTKILAMNKIREFCIKEGISWYWLRVFSLRGEREGDKWLIPMFEKKLLDPLETHIDLSHGMQRYAYLDIDIAVGYILRVVEKSDSRSGVYNISGSGARTIKDILIETRDRIRPDFNLNFGALETRPNQSQWIEGDMNKFLNEFGR